MTGQYASVLRLREGIAPQTWQASTSIGTRN
jgi:hypothetical protein